jgi:hypothetical protein
MTLHFSLVHIQTMKNAANDNSYEPFRWTSLSWQTRVILRNQLRQKKQVDDSAPKDQGKADSGEHEDRGGKLPDVGAA